MGSPVAWSGAGSEGASARRTPDRNLARYPTAGATTELAQQRRGADAKKSAGQRTTGVAPAWALALLVGRRRALLLEALRTAMTTGEAAAATGIAASTASEHLHDLARAGMLDRRRSGRHVYYMLSERGQRLLDDLCPSAPESEA